MTIHQDANLYIARLDKNGEAKHSLPVGRHAWVQIARGAVHLNGGANSAVKAGDGAAISNETAIRVKATEPSEILLFDLA